MSASLSKLRLQDCGFGIFCIDTELFRPGLAACYLLSHGDQAAFIDTGTRNSVPILLNALQKTGLELSQVRWVMPTHVHLDHAGGAGALMQLLPNARLLVHERGARHLVNPDKLQAGSLAVYGRERYEKAFGSLIPVPEERVVVACDGLDVELAGRQLHILDTPGHARHHYVVWDVLSRGLFTGDTFGVSYPELNTGRQRFIFPPSTPVQFDPTAWHHSVDRLMALCPERVFLTHFGMHEDLAGLAGSLHEQIDVYVDISTSMQASNASILAEKLMQHSLQTLQGHECDVSPERIRQLLAGDMELNAQGLMHWLQTTPPSTSAASV